MLERAFVLFLLSFVIFPAVGAAVSAIFEGQRKWVRAFLIIIAIIVAHALIEAFAFPKGYLIQFLREKMWALLADGFGIHQIKFIAEHIRLAVGIQHFLRDAVFMVPSIALRLVFVKERWYGWVLFWTLLPVFLIASKFTGSGWAVACGWYFVLRIEGNEMNRVEPKNIIAETNE